MAATQIGQQLKSLIGNDHPLKDYPATSPLLALQVILDSFQQQEQTNSQLNVQSIVRDISFSPDGQQLAMGSV